MSQKLIFIIVALIFIFMAALTIGSMWNESAIVDESPHIPAGYSYLKFKDYRLNPEHPPLAKAIAALPLQFENIKFPTESEAWQKNVNDQWTIGPLFLYESDNNADKIIRSARLAILSLFLILGFLIFRFVRNVYGTRVGLLSLFLFAFSPTFLAHARYVTTDVGASLGFFIGIFYFLRYLKQRSLKSLIFAGITLGIALLLKFSVFLLIPFLAFLALIAALINWQPPQEHRQTSAWKNASRLGFGLLGILAIASILIWVAYAYTTYNYPIERNQSDIAHNLSSFGSRLLANLDYKLAGISVLRPWAQYAHGLLMVAQRAVGGNTTYFWGEV